MASAWLAGELAHAPHSEQPWPQAVQSPDHISPPLYTQILQLFSLRKIYMIYNYCDSPFLRQMC